MKPSNCYDYYFEQYGKVFFGDTIDWRLFKAQEMDAHFREQAMATHRQHTQTNSMSRTHCEDCGEEIPEGRRVAAKGCTRCRDCQQAMENDNR